MSKFILTNAESCGKIHLIITFGSNKDVKIEREIEKMESNSIPVADFLIEQFIKARIDGKQLICSRTKLGKLMTIIQILSVKVFNSFIFENVIREDSCGTSIPDLSALGYPYYVTNSSGLTSEEDSCTCDWFESGLPEGVLSNSLDQSTGENIGDSSGLTDCQKQVIIDVFMRFGGCESIALGQQIDAIKGNICVNGILNFDKVKSWLEELQKTERESNSLIDYIKSY